jgi:argininosuccinate lyase
VSDIPANEPPSGTGLWGGRFEGGLAPEMVPLNASLSTDRRLWRHDIRGSRAWAFALGKAGVLGTDEAARIVEGLDRVAARLEDGGIDGGGFDDAPDEDIHSLVERLLRDEIGDLAGKLHSGRSRNDQVSTDFRMWTLENGARVDEALVVLGRGLLALAERSRDVIMPGYTHLQQGQPVRAAHWSLSHLWPVLRDRRRLHAALHGAGVLPLGSGAIAGCPFPVDREAVARELGFHSVSPNSIDAVGERDWATDVLYAGALIGVHLSRLAEDLVIFSSLEFGFLRLSDGYSTGSSLMPQKRNPDVAELTRGKTGRLLGNLTGLLTLLKGLPTGYNRDLQEDKQFVFDTVDTLLLVLPALAGALATCELRPERVNEALDTQLLATDLADHLVRLGVPFRESHEVVGRLVRRAERDGISLAELGADTLAEAHPALGSGAAEVFDWERSVESRDLPGGTSRRSVAAQMEAARAALAEPPTVSGGPSQVS